MTPPETLTITEDVTDGRTLLAMHGELDIATADGARGRIEAAIAASNDVDIDLTGVTFIDSYGIRALVSLHGVVEPGRGAFQIVDASPQVRRTFTVTGLDLAYLWPSERL